MAEDKGSIHVSIGEAVIAQGNAALETFGLGSCIALVLYDPNTSIGGLAHIMLPSDKGRISNTHPYKYCNTAIPKLIEALLRKGAKRKSLNAKLIGGSKMFTHLIPKEFMDIGLKNVQAVRKELMKYNIPIIAEDTGGTHGRSITFTLKDGNVKVSSYHRGIINL